MIRTLSGALALACLCGLFGCATVVHGTTEQVQIDSTPEGAEVVIDDAGQSVTTPATVKLARRQSHTLVFHKAGFRDATAHLTSSPSGWILGNIISGGVVGMAIDASDGAARKLSSDHAAVTLTALPGDAQPLSLPAQSQRRAPADKSNGQYHEHDSVMVPVRPEGPPLDSFSDD